MAPSCCCPKKPRCKRRRRKLKKKCCKPRAIAKKAYMCFLHTFKLKHCNWPSLKISFEGAKRWCQMTARQKLKYFERAKRMMGCTAKIRIPGCKCNRKKKRHTCKKKKRKRRRRRHYCRREDIGCGEKKCCKAAEPCPKCEH